MSRLRVAFVSVVPSPYQRDLFAALAAREDVELSVFYLEDASPDSPWPKKALAAYERILPGTWFWLGKTARVHINLPPQLCGYDFVVMNNIMSITAQWLMRVALRGQKWLFWAEKLGPASRLQRTLTGALTGAAGIVGIGSWAQRDYAVRFPAQRHFTLPYHCSLERFLATPRPRANDGRLIFFFCGQMIARKGLDVLLAAFARLAAEHPHVHLLLVGREAELPQMLSALPETTRVRIEYAGFQAPDALPEFFARADVFLLPSRYDGWGVVVNQAVGSGLPVICSDQVGAGHDLVADGENGAKFTAGDADSLHAAMARYATDPALAAAHGNASRTRAADYTPARGAEKWAHIFHELSNA